MNAEISRPARHVQRGAAARGSAVAESSPPRRSRLAFLATIVSAAVLAVAGCGPKDPVSEEKSRTLTHDERYIVELYMKINDLERNLQDNPADSLEKWAGLRADVDTLRVQRALADLERNPERWLGIFNRINELAAGRR